MFNHIQFNVNTCENPENEAYCLNFLVSSISDFVLLFRQSEHAFSWQYVLPGFDQIFMILLSPHTSLQPSYRKSNTESLHFNK